MKINDKLKEFINNNGYKKMIYNLIAIVIICTIVLIVWDTFSTKEIASDSNSQIQQSVGLENTDLKNGYQDSAELQLKTILGQIKGVGDVDVMITYETSSEVIPASNVTKSNQIMEEKDAQGGTRTTSEENLSENVVTSNESSKLIVIKEIKPQIRGVVVVAQGAGDIKVKNDLIEAVRTIFQIPVSKVIVYEKNS